MPWLSIASRFSSSRSRSPAYIRRRARAFPQTIQKTVGGQNTIWQDRQLAQTPNGLPHRVLAVIGGYLVTQGRPHPAADFQLSSKESRHDSNGQDRRQRLYVLAASDARAKPRTGRLVARRQLARWVEDSCSGEGRLTHSRANSSRQGGLSPVVDCRLGGLPRSHRSIRCHSRRRDCGSTVSGALTTACYTLPPTRLDLMTSNRLVGRAAPRQIQALPRPQTVRRSSSAIQAEKLNLR